MAEDKRYIAFTVPGKQRPRFSRQGTAVRTYTPRQTAEYERLVKDSYIAAGGKDSDVLLDLAIKSGIDFEVSHSITTVDAPQTNRHVNRVFAELKEKGIKAYKIMPTYKGKPINMFSLIAQKGIPPTKLVRYCCGVFKEGTEKKQGCCFGGKVGRVKKKAK